MWYASQNKAQKYWLSAVCKMIQQYRKPTKTSLPPTRLARWVRHDAEEEEEEKESEEEEQEEEKKRGEQRRRRSSVVETVS